MRVPSWTATRLRLRPPSTAAPPSRSSRASPPRPGPTATSRWRGGRSGAAPSSRPAPWSPRAAEMRTIVVAGALAAKAGNGGEAWVRLSWMLGLRRLGLDAWLLEEAEPETARAGEGFFRRTVARHGIASRAVLLSGDETVGAIGREELEALAEESEALINISGNLHDPVILDRFSKRAYVDLDPGFTQLWHDDGQLGDQLELHDRHFTVGLNVGDR